MAEPSIDVENNNGGDRLESEETIEAMRTGIAEWPPREGQQSDGDQGEDPPAEHKASMRTLRCRQLVKWLPPVMDRRDFSAHLVSTFPCGLVSHLRQGRQHRIGAEGLSRVSLLAKMQVPIGTCRFGIDGEPVLRPCRCHGGGEWGHRGSGAPGLTAGAPGAPPPGPRPGTSPTASSGTVHPSTWGSCRRSAPGRDGQTVRWCGSTPGG